MKFRVKDTRANTQWREGREADDLMSKVVLYEEDFDYIDPDDPNGCEYTLPFDCHTVIEMLKSLPKGVRWNPRTDSFEGW